MHRNYLSRNSVSSEAKKNPSDFIVNHAGRVSALIPRLTGDKTKLNAESIFLEFLTTPIEGLNSDGVVENNLLAATAWRNVSVDGVRVRAIIKFNCTRLGELNAMRTHVYGGSQIAAILWHELSHIALDRQDQEPNIDAYRGAYEKFGHQVTVSEGLLSEFLTWDELNSNTDLPEAPELPDTPIPGPPPPGP